MARRCRACNGLNPDQDREVGYTYCECREKPMVIRDARVSVLLSMSFLTEDAEITEEAGWAEIEGEIKAMLTRRYPGFTGYKIEFEEWYGDPEPHEGSFPAPTENGGEQDVRDG